VLYLAITIAEQLLLYVVGFYNTGTSYNTGKSYNTGNSYNTGKFSLLLINITTMRNSSQVTWLSKLLF